MDRLTPEQRRRNMQAIRSKNTKIEVLLGKSMWALGLRYKKNDKSVIGKPDFVFKKYRVAVFCDSEFWHGKDWAILQARLNTNRKFWVEKITRNIQRDIIVNEQLEKEGWIVLRFWEKEIKKELQKCSLLVISKINSLKQQVP